MFGSAFPASARLPRGQEQDILSSQSPISTSSGDLSWPTAPVVLPRWRRLPLALSAGSVTGWVKKRDLERAIGRSRREEGVARGASIYLNLTAIFPKTS